MNITSIDFKPFIEFDSNPFILFNSSAKLIYLNTSAEILLGHISQKELFNLALSYAPKDFGFKQTNIDLHYDVFNFHAIMVGYENEEELAIRFYNKPTIINPRTLEQSKLILTDINILLEANIYLFKNKYKSNKLKLLVDQEIPHIKTDQNSISKLIRDTLEMFHDASFIDISLKMVIGSHIIINDKKFPLIELALKADKHTIILNSNTKELAKENHVKIVYKDSTVKLEIPVIT